MQDRPDRTTLLQAVAAFLSDEVAAAVTDPALAFRVRIAAHALGGVAREVGSEEADDAEELRALQDLLGASDPTPPGAAARREAIARARAALARRLRDAPLSPADFDRCLSTLKTLAGARASIGQPRFDRSDDPERPEPR